MTITVPSPANLVTIPVDDWVETFVKDWLVPNFRPFFRALAWPVDHLLQGLTVFLHGTPMLVITIAFGLAAWRVAGKGVAIFTVVALCFIDMIQLWQETMTTLAMIVTAVVFCTIVGIPLGIVAARSDGFRMVIRPILDVMQTIPSFVYLIPIVMLFGIGMVPGIIATIIFALPPIIRLTDLGIRNVRGDLVEAAKAFGSTPWQILWEVQFPLALRTVMAGLNQTLMLALSMVVIAALIGAGGLGLLVYTNLGSLNVGGATVSGVSIVLLAVILDRMTQALGEGRPAQTAPRRRGLLGFFRRSGESPDAGKPDQAG